MNHTITQAMCDDMDSTADFMHQVPAPFPSIEHAVGLPPCRPPTLYRTNGLVTPYSRGISIPSREQGEADAHRRHALKKGGI